MVPSFKIANTFINSAMLIFKKLFIWKQETKVMQDYNKSNLSQEHFHLIVMRWPYIRSISTVDVSAVVCIN